PSPDPPPLHSFPTRRSSDLRTIHITTPYFLPDRSSLNEMCTAAHRRGVQVVVLTPGRHSDHLFTRSSARRLYGELLKAGAKVYRSEEHTSELQSRSDLVCRL